MEQSLEIDFKEYMTIYEIAEKKFNKKSTNDYFINKLKQTILELPSENKITTINLETNYYDKQFEKYVKEMYLKSDVDLFFFNYESKQVLIKELNAFVSKDTFYKYYRKLTPNEIILGGNLDIFISKKISQKLREIIKVVSSKGRWGWRTHTFENYKNRFGYLSFDEVMKKLNCSFATTQRLINEKLLVVSDQYGDRKLFDKDHVLELHSEQEKLIEKYKKNYYSSKQIQEKYNDSFAHYIKGSEDKVRRKITKVDPPLLLISYFGVQMKLYKKAEIDNLWEDYKLYRDMNSMSLEEPFDDFIYKVEQVLNIKFTTKQKNTKLLWYQYVEKFLISTRMSDKSRIIFQTNQFARCTELIFNIFKREIYSYSASEINKRFLNDSINIRRSYQRDFYIFLKQMLETFSIEGLPSPYNIDELCNPKNFKRIKEVATDIYSLEEYHELYNHTNRVTFHKEKAIQDVTNLIKQWIIQNINDMTVVGYIS
ncbi:hypothetical protein P4647_11620 [Peribacillus frigoritolerans]|uniref:hypothetical protein n=1 Tax=Peribacillus frigoritolerans TaxID=450367 RepID=UPI002E1A417E|nr:hypothetical protein [Peribacillus frigoritolerans]